MSVRPEWWGGAECTVNRVGQHYFEQLERTGHAHRLDDLDRIAALGIRRLRFPVLWERAWQAPTRSYDFSWSDLWIERLRSLGIEPILGLLHHGSGPPQTHLLDPDFPEEFARFAATVARRYPWVTCYTPINEVLTTARFSALYGHWYPHAKDDRSFVRALLSQVRATQLAMRAIRDVSPNAQLITTEDIGTTFATSALDYQARFDNQRRWLSLDLLLGWVRPGHELYTYLTRVGGASEAELEQIAAQPCEPSIIGLNYYVTSDRFLDHRIDLYPAALHGGNGRDCYADVEAVRSTGANIVGHCEILRLAWQRYERPLALTEVHLGCSDEAEQARWLEEAWLGACSACELGADIRAVTAWSLFGAFDWNSLVTRCDGHYEPGAFDTRCSPPRPTQVAHLIRQLANAGARQSQSALGWWRRTERCVYPAEEPSGVHPRQVLESAHVRKRQR